MIRIATRTVIATAFAAVLAGCGSGETPSAATLSAEITCTDQDSLLATVYMTQGEIAAASQWCACGSEGCSVEFDALGYGDYVVGISRPDSLYRRTAGAEGFARTLGYYSQAGFGEVADTISLSEEQPTASVAFDVAAGSMQGTQGAPGTEQADTLNQSITE